MPDDDAVDGVATSQLLDSFFADNLLEYTCEKCGHKQSRATHALHRLPRFLVIHCKRFKPNFEKGIYEKLATKVVVERELDLGKYCSRSTKIPPSCDPAHRIPLVMRAFVLVHRHAIGVGMLLHCSPCGMVHLATFKSAMGHD